MSDQQEPEDMIVLAASVRPPQLFEDEPTLIVYDCNNYIDDPPTELRPFYNLINMMNDPNTLRNRLSEMNRSFVVIFILPHWTNIQVQPFVQQNILIFPSVRFFYLTFINGQRSNIGTICGNRLIDSYSITSKILRQTLNACATANDLNIIYCEQQRRENETNHEVGVANAFTLQKSQRVQLQLDYNEQLRLEIERLILQ